MILPETELPPQLSGTGSNPRRPAQYSSRRQSIILKQGIDKAVDAAVIKIQDCSKAVDGRDDIARVAAISANDDEIGEMIARAMEKFPRRRYYCRRVSDHGH